MRTAQVAQAEVSFLSALVTRVPANSAFGDSNHDAISAQITVVSERLTEEDVDRRFGMAAKNVHAAAIEAAEWVRGASDEAPSAGWMELLS